MINIEEIKNYISDSVLDNIFENREEELYNTKDLNKEILEIKNDKIMSYSNFEGIIKNLPPHFGNCRESILNALEEYVDREGLIQASQHYFLA